jgi:Tol biopolymer transport system component/DNA-binding winged helix-turn-helix (wHTH) protein
MATRIKGWRFGVFEADSESHELRKYGVHIKLAGQPFQALSLLLQRPGEVVTREELRNALWPGEPWGDHDQRLNKAINKVRDSLNDSADTPRLIETVPRVGYRFLGSVHPLMSPVAEAPPPPAVPAAEAISEPLTPLPPPGPAPLHSPRPITRWIAVMVAIAALAGVIVYRTATVSHAATMKERWLSGSEATPLTTYVGSEQYPAFSPDGTKIAFAWDGPSDGGMHIYTISTNGRDLKQVSAGEFSDYGPVWSPDGKTLAFMRETVTHVKELWTSQSDGSGARRIADFGRVARWDHPLAWTRDPRWIVAAARPSGEGPPALYLLSASSGERRRLTSPPLQSAGDLSPSISPNGKRIAFTRGLNVARREVFVVTVSDDFWPLGEPVRMTNLERIIDMAVWNSDGKSLYFSTSVTPSGARHILRLNVSGAETGGVPTETGIEGIHPIVSPDGQFLCYVRNNIEQTSIWRLALNDGSPASKEPELKRSLLLSSTRRDYTADLSPDGKQMVFSSIRSGVSEIWISNIDGANLRQITFKGASTPRWSPDGRWLVYESSASGQPNIYVFDLKANQERRLTNDPDAALRPSWSRDSQFVYFSSTRSGKGQIFKVSLNRGGEKQITHEGGIYAIEAPDRTLYYTSADQPPSIRSVPAHGGLETTLVDDVVGHSAIALTRGGLCYLDSIGFNGARIGFYSFAERVPRPLISIDHPVHHFLSSSPGGTSVLFTQVDRQDSDLMLLPLTNSAAQSQLAAR